MAITVRTGSALKALFGGEREISASGTTIGELLDGLNVRDRICDDAGKVRRHFNIHVNEGEDIRLLDGLDTPIKDGDTVTILSAIAGGDETKKKVWLTFPSDLVERPLIWEVAQKFRVVTNIRQASISKEIGLVGLELSGEAEEVQQAIDFLIENGVSVEPIEMNVVE
ncbi:NIL domain-containing protein [Candidatus Poribacteria bacterium]